jgi:hypothetical protein
MAILAFTASSHGRSRLVGGRDCALFVATAMFEQAVVVVRRPALERGTMRSKVG